MFWFKRIAVLVIIAAAAGGFYWYDRYTVGQEVALADRTALATAKVWVLTAYYKGDAGQYFPKRDSILSEFGIVADSMLVYLRRYEEKPERYGYFVGKVREYVDSLADREDSLIAAGVYSDEFRPESTETLQTR